jgi:hypothetical protein
MNARVAQKAGARGNACTTLVKIAVAAALVIPARAQLITGTLEGAAAPGTPITVTGGPGRTVRTAADAQGRFKLILPAGRYEVENGSSRTAAYVPALGTAHTGEPADSPLPCPALTLHSCLLSVEPGVVTDPVDFTGLGSMRLPLISYRSYSWTTTRFRWQGLNATDPYEPGRAVIFPDVQTAGDVVTLPRPEIALSGTGTAACEGCTGFKGWHGAISSSGTGAPLASGNLSSAAREAGLQRSEHFQWFTRDHVELGGPATRRADLFFSGTEQWASQTVARTQSQDLKSRLQFGNARGRLRAGRADQIDAGFSGSRIDLNDWGLPAGIEALMGRRMSPELRVENGFAGLREEDHLDFAHAGWTHPFPRGALEVRYGYSMAHLDTIPTARGGPSRIDLAQGVLNGVPPLANMAVRTRHVFETAFEVFAGSRHRISAGGGWEIAHARNRFTAPGDANLIEANGSAAFLVVLNTPLDSREAIRGGHLNVRDRIALTRWLTADAALDGDFARGRAGGANAISWNSAAPRAGISIAPPFFSRLVLHAGFARYHAPLAGRYLDFAGGGLGGAVYPAPGGPTPAQAGMPPLLRFGGPVSSIERALRPPYADEFDVGADARLPWGARASVRLFRRDEKRRIAAVNTGVPASAFHPIAIPDPGPDSLPGTFDDQRITVYAQDPSTFGEDRYLLTNPPELRMFYEGVAAESGSRWRAVTARASFLAVKSRGPANPGDSPFENDSGVVGALYADPNTLVNASGRGYFDRAFVGKLQVAARLPRRLGGIDWSNTANYLDGLVFARQLLVEGLPQGPMLVAATVRGSPEGGNRAEYIVNWNMRVSRAVRLPVGSLTLGADIFNVTNANNRTRERDIAGPLFNRRLPLAIEPARFVRFDVSFAF